MGERRGPQLRPRPAAEVGRSLVLVAGLLVLLAAVAITAGMGRPADQATRGVQVPPAVLIAWGGAAALAAGLALSLLGPFWSRREKWVGLWLALLLLLGFAILAERSYLQTTQAPPRPQQVVTPAPALTTPLPQESQPPPPSQQATRPPPQGTSAGMPPWVLAIAGAAALLLAAVALRFGGRMRAGGDRPLPAAAAVGDVVDASLADLDAETDPRRAVIAAWLGMADALGQHGLRRRPDEAAVEYMQRALAAVRVRPDSVRRLTALFQRARYSDHPATPAMRDEALGALRSVRDDLDGVRG